RARRCTLQLGTKFIRRARGLADGLGTCITGALGPPRHTGQPSPLRGALHISNKSSIVVWPTRTKLGAGEANSPSSQRPVETCIANALASQTRGACRQPPPLRQALHIQQSLALAWPTHVKLGRRRGKLADPPRGLGTCIANAIPRPSQTRGTCRQPSLRYVECYTCDESSVVPWPNRAQFGRRRSERVHLRPGADA
ncbi:hypothetical protein T492DRAFT_1094066, partial [Pavlovales sp. CCMP2436]